MPGRRKLTITAYPVEVNVMFDVSCYNLHSSLRVLRKTCIVSVQDSEIKSVPDKVCLVDTKLYALAEALRLAKPQAGFNMQYNKQK